MQLFHLHRTSSLLFNNLTHILVELSPQEGSCKPERLPVQEASFHCWSCHLENMVVLSQGEELCKQKTKTFPKCWLLWKLKWRIISQFGLFGLERLLPTCFRLASLIFRTCLCCVYSLSFPGHFGNSNPSLSLITHTTHSTSGLGLPEWLICRCFFIAVI